MKSKVDQDLIQDVESESYEFSLGSDMSERILRRRNFLFGFSIRIMQFLSIARIKFSKL